jgi:microcystin-dependent protein
MAMKNILKISSLLWCFALGVPAASAQELPVVIQGVLKNADGTAFANGTYSLTFKLYLSSEGDATPIWSETQNNVRVDAGIYSVALGAVEPIRLLFDKPYFLGVSIGDSPELLPRSELTAAPSALFATRGGGGVESGQIIPFAGYFNKIPFGWLPCDGRALKSSEYPTLFAVIGTIYGNGTTGTGAGNGTDFNLPDFSNQFLRGVNDDRLPNYQRDLNSKEGFLTGLPKKPFVGTSTTDGAHTHSATTYRLPYKSDRKASWPGGSLISGTLSAAGVSTAGSHGHSAYITGGGDLETRPRNRALIFCIKI